MNDADLYEKIYNLWMNYQSNNEEWNILLLKLLDDVKIAFSKKEEKQ